MTKIERIASRITAGLIADRLLAGMNEQRSHLPGDIGWTTQSPDEEHDIKEKEQPSDCTQCRRSWASSGIPGGTQEENSSDWKGTLCSASSIVPGDAYQLSEGMDTQVYHNQNEDINGVAIHDKMEGDKIASDILSGDKAMYRHDPKHHHRPLGGKWRRTTDGWSQLPADAKPGPVPEKKVEHKPGTEGVKQVDTQTQNG